MSSLLYRLGHAVAALVPRGQRVETPAAAVVFTCRSLAPLHDILPAGGMRVLSSASRPGEAT